MSVTVYGIPNCDTVRKARGWLDRAGIAHAFHDYKKLGVDPARLARWSGKVGWERLLNRAGTTFRKLPEAEREGLDEAGALMLMARNPSCIRRPVVEYPGAILVGFKEPEWAEALC